MIRQLLSKLPEPRPADWGWNVSVCVAALSEGGKYIVCASDMKVGFGNFSADNLAVKSNPLDVNWFALYAGNDVDHVAPIIQRAKREIVLKYVSDALGGLKYDMSASVVADILDGAYVTETHKQIENKILRKHGYTVDSFRRLGKKRMTEATYNSIVNRIEKTSLSLQFLLCGFTDDKSGHIWLVGGDDSPRSFDSIGMFAIGTGGHSALSALAFQADKHGLTAYSELATTIYCVCEAKFMAESESQVGQRTFVTIFEHGKTVSFISDAGINTIKKAWRRSGSPRIPKTILREIPKLKYDLSERTSPEETEAYLDALMGKSGWTKKLIAKANKQSTKPSANFLPGLG